jgi:hypothetical protein
MAQKEKDLNYKLYKYKNPNATKYGNGTRGNSDPTKNTKHLC